MRLVECSESCGDRRITSNLSVPARVPCRKRQFPPVETAVVVPILHLISYNCGCVVKHRRKNAAMIVFRTISSAAAGVIATIPMTAVMFALYKYLPPSQQYELPPGQITERAVEKSGLRLRGTAKRIATWISHFAMGGISGAFYTPVSPVRRYPAVLKGSVFGLFVWAANYLGLLPAADILPPATEHPTRRNALMIASHLVWGAALGLLVDAVNQNVPA